MEEIDRNLQNELKKHFVENRSRLIDIAAYLDRLGRSKNFDQIKNDFRWISFLKSMEVLVNEEFSSDQSRVLRIQEIFSDPTLDVLEDRPEASGQNADGASRQVHLNKKNDSSHSDCC